MNETGTFLFPLADRSPLSADPSGRLSISLQIENGRDFPGTKKKNCARYAWNHVSHQRRPSVRDPLINERPGLFVTPDKQLVAGGAIILPRVVRRRSVVKRPPIWPHAEESIMALLTLASAHHRKANDVSDVRESVGPSLK